jgi:signal transduction histidine kinase
VKGARGSLTARLTLAIVSVLGLTLCAFSLLLYGSFSRLLWQHFDEQLADDARAVADMVEERAKGPWEFESGAIDELDGRGDRRESFQFEARMDDGSLLADSRSLRGREWPERSALAAEPGVHVIALPDGRAARLLRTALLPRLDQDAPVRRSGRRVTVVVARATAEIEANLASLRGLLWATGLTTLLLAALAAVLAIRRGLAPITWVSARADAIDAQRLSERLPVDALPHELRPMVLKLNELLARLQISFDRERQFTSDASHELRTPLAGLRAILEVSGSRERPAAEHRLALGQALSVVEQMNRLVEDLSRLARIDAPELEIRRELVDVGALVEECFTPLSEPAAASQLSLDNRIAPGTTLVADREKLRLVIANLLGNATQYADPGSRIIVESDPAQGRVFAITNHGPSIPAGSIDTIFDRFVRLEKGRGNLGGYHFGIGLALVRKLCDRIGLSVSAQNLSDGSVTFVVDSSTP